MKRAAFAPGNNPRPGSADIERPSLVALNFGDPDLEKNKAKPTLEEIYRDHFDAVYRIAKRLGGLLVDTEDVVQEVFIVVGRKLDTYDATARVTTWLYGITFNVVRHMRRRRLRELRFRADEAEAAEIPADGVDVGDVFAAWRIANEILDGMPSNKREVFILAEFEGLSAAEIGEIVGVGEATVWSRLHYARRLFSDRLERRRKRRSAAE